MTVITSTGKVLSVGDGDGVVIVDAWSGQPLMTVDDLGDDQVIRRPNRGEQSQCRRLRGLRRSVGQLPRDRGGTLEAGPGDGAADGPAEDRGPAVAAL
jgi:hypothetical protein